MICCCENVIICIKKSDRCRCGIVTRNGCLVSCVGYTEKSGINVKKINSLFGSVILNGISVAHAPLNI